MSRVRVASFSLSLDGFGAGPAQDLENPLGVGGEALHGWVFPTRTFRRMFEGKDGTTGVDERFAARGFEGVGAWILGRNMFGPIRGAWPDESWKGWWGEEPPYRAPVFVLCSHHREPIQLTGTTFHFVTGGIHEALGEAREAAGERDVAIAGGAATINQYLAAGLIDELRLHVAPVLLTHGERLFEGVPRTELVQVSARSTALVTHLNYAVQT